MPSAEELNYILRLPDPITMLDQEQRRILRDHLAVWLQTLANGDATCAPLGAQGNPNEDYGDHPESGSGYQKRAYDDLLPVFQALFPGDDPWNDLKEPS